MKIALFVTISQMITISISPRPLILCMITMSVLLCALCTAIYAYFVIVNLKGITIIDSEFEFGDFNDNIICLGIARSGIVGSLLPFTKHWCHYNTFVVTNKGTYILSPISKMVYILKVHSNEINYKDYIIECPSGVFYIDKLYKPDKPITLMHYCELYSNECAAQYYKMWHNNCQHTTTRTLQRIVGRLTDPIIDGMHLFLLICKELVRTLTFGVLFQTEHAHKHSKHRRVHRGKELPHSLTEGLHPLVIEDIQSSMVSKTSRRGKSKPIVSEQTKNNKLTYHIDDTH